MINKDQAIQADEFHLQNSFKDKKCFRYRRNGRTKLWKTRPADFSVPVKFGLSVTGHIDQSNAHRFHVASECEASK